MDNASPATISRCGMVYLSDSAIDSMDIVNQFVKMLKMPEIYKKDLNDQLLLVLPVALKETYSFEAPI